MWGLLQTIEEGMEIRWDCETCKEITDFTVTNITYDDKKDIIICSDIVCSICNGEDVFYI